MPPERETPETPENTNTPSLMDAPPAVDKEKADDDVPADDGAGDDPAGDGDPADVDGDDKAPEEGGEEDGDGVPEEYADFVAPEGIELDAEAIEAFKPIAKELGLTQEQAQKLVDVQAATAQRWQDAVLEQVTQTRASWREAAQADSEIGGEKFVENLAVAKAGRDAFGDDDLKSLLDESGLGDHPAMIRFFYKVGKANSEHDFVTSGRPEKSKSFYDHPTSQK